MSAERGTHTVESVIDPEKLKLPDGSYANKMTMLRYAASCRLPVPNIISSGMLQAKADEIGPYRDDPDYPLEELKARRIWIRGYDEKPADMWTVNTLPTSAFYPDTLMSDQEHWMQKAWRADKVGPYLQRNFGINTVPVPQYFLQENTTCHGDSFYSLWSRGNHIYGTMYDHTKEGVSYFSLYQDDTKLDTYSRELLMFSFLQDTIFNKLLPLQTAIKTVMDKGLGGLYDYKVDYAGDIADVQIIQIRVASAATTEKTNTVAKRKIDKLRGSGVTVHSVEIGAVKALPDQPHILQLTNDWHEGIVNTRTMLNLDMRHMKGLMLPEGLNGGLLNHNGYVFIANALYRGLPITIG